MYICCIYSRLISFDYSKTYLFQLSYKKSAPQYYFTEARKIQVKVIYWFYSLLIKHDFRRVRRVTKLHDVTLIGVLWGAWANSRSITVWKFKRNHKQSQNWCWSAIYTNAWHVLTRICNTINFVLEFLLAFCAWMM